VAEQAVVSERDLFDRSNQPYLVRTKQAPNHRFKKQFPTRLNREFLCPYRELDRLIREPSEQNREIP
jgi:hypothetical protein